MHQNRILVVDDDRRLRQLLEEFLSSRGFRICTAENAMEARRMLEETNYALMVVDVMMPGENGLELVENLRKKHVATPILMLTALGEVEDRIRGFQKGVDDYLSKPFEPEELCARIEAILRRSGTPKQRGSITFGAFSYDLDRAELQKDGMPISLSTNEQKLLDILAARVGTPVAREELSRLLNGISERSVDVQITRLRRKIEDDPRAPRWLMTARGAGYVLKRGE